MNEFIFVIQFLIFLKNGTFLQIIDEIINFFTKQSTWEVFENPNQKPFLTKWWWSNNKVQINYF